MHPPRCRNHRPAETNATQRLRCYGEAVSPSFGMLHSGVSCRSNIFVMYNFPTLLVLIFGCTTHFWSWKHIFYLELRVNRWGGKCRDYSPEGAERRDRLQGGSSGSHPRYHGTHTSYLIALVSNLVCVLSCVYSGGFWGLCNDFFSHFIWIAVTCLDPGLSNCTTQMVLVNINGDEAENINPTQQLGKCRGFYQVEESLVYSRVGKPWLRNTVAFN